MNDFINITALDAHSGESTGKTFNVENKDDFKSSVLEWEKELPYSRYELITNEFLDEYSEEIQEVLEELEVENV